MSGVFIYWDNSSIFIGAQAAAVEREGGGKESRGAAAGVRRCRLPAGER